MSERPSFATRIKEGVALLRNRFVYNNLSRLDQYSETLLNYGYHGTEELRVDPEEEHLRSRLNLYYHVANGIDIVGKDVVEVGSGRGRGAYFIATSMNPRSLEAVDLSSQAIKFARKHYQTSGLRYSVGNAQNLSFPDSSFDVAINIESSHWYPNTKAFFAEIERVLRPGGHFLFADFRHIEDVSETELEIKSAGLTITTIEDITQNVIKALDRDSEHKQRLIKKAPASLSRPISIFAGMKRSSMYQSFATGRRVYTNYIIQKKA